MSLTKGCTAWFFFTKPELLLADANTKKKGSEQKEEEEEEGGATNEAAKPPPLLDAQNWARVDVADFADGVIAVPDQLKADPDLRAVCVQLSPLPLRLGDLYNVCVAPSCGAVSSFVGTTRNVFEGKPVERLEYEVYGKMALSSIAAIAFKCADSWHDVRRVVVSHRSGEVGIGHPSVVIHVSSVHRRDGLQAVNYAIDTLKADVPIWKREFYRRDRDEGDSMEGGEGEVVASQWKKNSECAGCKRHQHQHQH